MLRMDREPAGPVDVGQEDCKIKVNMGNLARFCFKILKISKKS